MEGTYTSRNDCKFQTPAELKQQKQTVAADAIKSIFDRSSFMLGAPELANPTLCEWQLRDCFSCYQSSQQRQLVDLGASGGRRNWLQTGARGLFYIVK